ncbi:ABC transporter permease [Sutcliffiella horikoshii]|uniref:ABC transporter permease n=1 Tax=Sutcliffiella horikoshii TaxID=79883 RepID=A0A5D4SZM2_9BACI|nr:ABC transporter permease [Sutcliffiella horikoshii]TYS67778.1 ABC transporter permease [Sutcliffiella horikoshii]
MNKYYLMKKLFQSMVTIFLVLIINFFLFRVMPGDPLAMIVRNPNASEEAIEKIKVLFGVDQPMYVQFWLYFKQLAQGDLGMSFMAKEPVIQVIGEKLVPTLLLVGLSTIVAIIAGMFIGIVAASKRGKKIDIISLTFSLITYAMPTFWLGIMLVVFFSVTLNLFPTSGMSTAGAVFANSFEKALDVSKHLFLPTLTLALVLIGQFVLIMRNSLLEVLTEDYITTAKAKGFSEKLIIRRHALPNAMLPMVTIIAINIGFMIAGAIQIETVFSWPGLGRLMYEALNNRDYPLLQGIFLIVSVCVVLANLCADIIYGYLDPRINNKA